MPATKLKPNDNLENYVPSKLVKPIVKWVGGKRQLMSDITKLLPTSAERYFEPFIGGGAVLFELQPKNAIINDTNSELINLYKTIKNTPEELITNLKTHKNEEEYFYEIRGKDRNKQVWENLSNVERASRFIFLNRTCFNGLYRVNSSGEFNAPFGRYKNPRIVDHITIHAINRYLNVCDVTILNGDYALALEQCKKGDFVYLDPPYDPVSDSANFTGYTSGGFTRQNQTKLKETCDQLNKKGAYFLLSNSSTEFINNLYSDYKIEHIRARRAINSNPTDRGEVAEVLVRNYV